MAEKYIQIANFKQGLDARRSELSTLPGALVRLENAHVNAGGEVEKRKAFVAKGSVANTFGLEVTEDGIVVFGSDAAPALAAGVTYQRLKHPAIEDAIGVAYDAAFHAMTAVLFSVNFNGKAFVCATFTDGNTFLYYDGLVVQHSRNGLVLAGETGVDLQSVLLGGQVARLGWSSANNTPFTGCNKIKTPSDVYFDIVEDDDSAAGALLFAFIDKDMIGTFSVSAVATFAVTAFAGTFTLQAPSHQDGTGVATLANAVVGVTSNTATAAAIVAAVNSNTPLTGYRATSVGAQVFVYANQDWGNFLYQLTVTLTGGATTAAAGAVAATASPSFVSGEVTSSATGFYTVFSDYTVASLFGSIATAYAWEEVSPGSGNGVLVVTPASATTRFKKNLGGFGQVSGTFRCKITYAGGANVYTNSVGVTLIHSRKESNL